MRDKRGCFGALFAGDDAIQAAIIDILPHQFRDRVARWLRVTPVRVTLLITR
jgi:hypothetical protein